MSGEKQLVPTGGNNVLDTSSLNGLMAQAMAMDETPVEQQVISTAEPLPQVEKPEAETPAVEAQQTEEKIFELPDNARVKVKIDGKEEVVEYKDYKDSLQREAVFTKRQQTLANQRRQAEQELAQMYAQLQIQAQVLQAQAQSQQQQPNIVEQLQAYANQQNQKQPKPDELVAHGELQSELNKALKQLQDQQTSSRQEVEQNVEKRIQQLMQNIQVKQEQDRFTSAIHQVLGDKDAAILSRVVPDVAYAEAIIRHKVAQLGAQSVDQGIEFAKEYVKEWVKNVKKETLGERQAESVQKAKQVLEPTGSGAAPGPQKPAGYQTIFKKDGTVDFNALSARAHALAATLEA